MPPITLCSHGVPLFPELGTLFPEKRTNTQNSGPAGLARPSLRSRHVDATVRPQGKPPKPSSMPPVKSPMRSR